MTPQGVPVPGSPTLGPASVPGLSTLTIQPAPLQLGLSPPNPLILEGEGHWGWICPVVTREGWSEEITGTPPGVPRAMQQGQH